VDTKCPSCGERLTISVSHGYTPQPNREHQVATRFDDAEKRGFFSKRVHELGEPHVPEPGFSGPAATIAAVDDPAARQRGCHGERLFRR
jgi:hypothetical protein